MARYASPHRLSVRCVFALPSAAGALCWRDEGLLDDATLLEAWRTGDRQAGTLLIERHFVALYRFFRSKVSSDIDDLVQQTVMGCLEARESFRVEACFRTLLFRIARRRLYDHFRVRRRLANIDFTISSVLALGTTPSAALHRRDMVSLVREALQELPVDDQMLIELRYWEDMSTEQLADVFEVAAQKPRPVRRPRPVRPQHGPTCHRLRVRLQRSSRRRRRKAQGSHQQTAVTLARTATGQRYGFLQAADGAG